MGKSAGIFNYKRVLVPYTEEQLYEVFKNHEYGHGRLSKADLKQAFSFLGSRNASFRAHAALLAADIDGDGYITCSEEWNRLVQYTKGCNYTLG